MGPNPGGTLLSPSLLNDPAAAPATSHAEFHVRLQILGADFLRVTHIGLSLMA